MEEVENGMLGKTGASREEVERVEVGTAKTQVSIT